VKKLYETDQIRPSMELYSVKEAYRILLNNVQLKLFFLLHYQILKILSTLHGLILEFQALFR